MKSNVFVQEQPCKNCKKTFTLYVDSHPTQNVPEFNTHWDCKCPHCDTANSFNRGAVDIRDVKQLPMNAVHATIIKD